MPCRWAVAVRIYLLHHQTAVLPLAPAYDDPQGRAGDRRSSDEAVHHLLDPGGGDGEAQPLGRAVVCHDLDGGHPHHLAPVIEQGAPGAAIVDGCAGLEEVHGGPFH